MDYLDDTLKDPEEVERFLQLPNLGVVPDFHSLETVDQPKLRLLNGGADRIEEREQSNEANALILSPSKAAITGARPLTAAISPARSNSRGA